MFRPRFSQGYWVYPHIYEYPLISVGNLSGPVAIPLV